MDGNEALLLSHLCPTCMQMDGNGSPHICMHTDQWAQSFNLNKPSFIMNMNNRKAVYIEDSRIRI